jgi:hypothetical protein
MQPEQLAGLEEASQWRAVQALTERSAVAKQAVLGGLVPFYDR